jgi:hypothetical protein
MICCWGIWCRLEKGLLTFPELPILAVYHEIYVGLGRERVIILSLVRRLATMYALSQQDVKLPNLGLHLSLIHDAQKAFFPC